MTSHNAESPAVVRIGGICRTEHESRIAIVHIHNDQRQVVRQLVGRIAPPTDVCNQRVGGAFCVFAESDRQHTLELGIAEELANAMSPNSTALTVNQRLLIIAFLPSLAVAGLMTRRAP
jgi:hypothetical protein